MGRLHLEKLEGRWLLSAAPTPSIFPTIRIHNVPGTLRPLATAGPVGNTPAQLRHAYGFDNLIVGNGVFADGSGQTIAIIDSFDNPNFVSSSDLNYATSDLALFDQQFGLPQFGLPGGPTFTKVDQTGGQNYPTADTGWGTEIALDVEWVHALAPGANIVLVEAYSPSYPDLVTAGVGWARTQPGVSVVTMSFGSLEFQNEQAFDSTFTTPSGHNNITFTAASGDDGNPGIYPAYSPNVLAVGGTSLTLDNNNNISTETGWAGSGGGISNSLGRESKPSYQSSIHISNTRRMIPDVSIVADPNTGVAVYDSFSEGSAAPWLQVGGTSLSSPLWAALIGVTDQVRGLAGLGTLDGRNQTLPSLYSMAATDFHDIKQGNNGKAAGTGYDLVTGRGTPVAASIVGDFVGAAPGKPDLTAGSDSGSSNSDNVTNVASPHFTGTASTGLTVQLLSDGNVVGSGIASGGNYDIVPTSPLPDGPHNMTARVGARSSASGISIIIDTIAPAVSNESFTYDVSHAVVFTFNQDLSTKVSQGSATFAPSGGGAMINTIDYQYQMGANTATFVLPKSMSDGNYTATFLPNGIADPAGNAMASVTFDFFVFAGDANHDRVVDITDLSILATNFGATGVPFSQGDFNYDGVVDRTDLGILSSHWQSVLTPPTSQLSAAIIATAPKRTAFRVIDQVQ